jgi:hypothetical protein
MANSNPDEMKPGLVTVRTFISEFEALVVKSALEAAGIDCMISADDCAGLRPSLSRRRGSGWLSDRKTPAGPKKF